MNLCPPPHFEAPSHAYVLGDCLGTDQGASGWPGWLATQPCTMSFKVL